MGSNQLALVRYGGMGSNESQLLAPYGLFALLPIAGCLVMVVVGILTRIIRIRTAENQMIF